ncbi:uncharacterized protein LOC111712562 isoform X2 [Eurytemora carolleeae]|uniref:uncharacterized protein LOC111712562 isoform X2 n=1 Tax=Eurytemora carolleeae TaxID=1294199 RepID=UPI000C78641A|nr:uncharacterized protein LOC111712562 isoform X2 [Eurytemora carolleeae]|eukprot:XP_023342981.1 uncharacterized protein LOC111712562 isoform X2 [Eurytemora affinis]
MWRKFLILLSSLNLVVGPAASYDRSKYELEDRLIRRDSQPRLRQHRTGLRQHRTGLRHDELDVPIIAAALNYRLPVIPTNTPQLLTNINKNITTYPGSYLGGTVVLPCRVLDLGSVSVSWIRTPDLTVLTFGEIMFSSSPRLKLLHSAGSLDWNLQLNSVELEDTGVYECQVNTEPKITRAVYLLVTEEVQERIGRAGHPVPALALQAERVPGERVQRTEILAPGEIRVVEGGSVTLECVVTEHTTPPHFFTW